MMRVAPLFLVAVLGGPALAITPLPDAQSMAVRSGLVLGSAAACGVSDARIAAVRRTTLDLIRQVAFDRADARAAEQQHDRARREAQGRTDRASCKAAINAFGRAERN